MKHEQAEEMHKEIFLALFKQYQSGVGVDYEAQPPNEIGVHLANEANIILKHYMETKNITR